MNSPLQTGRPLIRMALKDYQSVEEVAFRVSMFWQLQQYRSLVQSCFSLEDSRRELRAMLGSDIKLNAKLYSFAVFLCLSPS